MALAFDHYQQEIELPKPIPLRVLAKITRLVGVRSTSRCYKAQLFAVSPTCAASYFSDSIVGPKTSGGVIKPSVTGRACHEVETVREAHRGCAEHFAGET